MNAALTEQIAPEIAQALITQAAARGLSVNEYLARLLESPAAYNLRRNQRPLTSL